MTCSTLGFGDSGDVTISPTPVYNQETLANATVYNSFYPANPPDQDPEMRSGYVNFFWCPAPALGLPMVQITPVPGDNANAPVLGCESQAIPYGSSGLAQLGWIVNQANLGVSTSGSSTTITVTGKLLAIANTNALGDGSGVGMGNCVAVNPPSSTFAPSAYAMKSVTYSIANVPVGSSAELIEQNEAELFAAPQERRECENTQILAFGVGSSRARSGPVTIRVRALGRPRSLRDFKFTTPEIRIGVEPADHADAREILTGVLSSGAARPVLERVKLVSSEVRFDLRPEVFRQSILSVPTSSTSLEACLIEIVMIQDGRLVESTVVGIRNDRARPVWL